MGKSLGNHERVRNSQSKRAIGGCAIEVSVYNFHSWIRKGSVMFFAFIMNLTKQARDVEMSLF